MAVEDEDPRDPDADPPVDDPDDGWVDDPDAAAGPEPDPDDDAPDDDGDGDDGDDGDGDDADDPDDPDDPEAPVRRLGPSAELRAFAGRLLAALDLEAGEVAHAHLAEQALWLVAVNHDDALGLELEDLLAGRGFSPLVEHTVLEPAWVRLALALLLQRRASLRGPGAAQRTLAALGALSLACADPDLGARLRRGFGRLELLEVVEQIPVAQRVRLLALEYRHMPPSVALPAGFVARLEDLLEQLDAEALLPYGLDDLPGRSASAADAQLEALLPGASRRRLALARVLFSADAPFPDLDALTAACAAAAPHAWGPDDGEAVARAYAELREALEQTPFALREDGFGRLSG